MAETLRRRELLVNGRRLSFVERGQPRQSRASIHCLHGLVATAESFAELSNSLPADWHLISLDMPGNGFTESPADLDVGFAALARVVEAFMAAAGLDRPVLLGHSHGGAVALVLAASRPELVRALVLIAPAHPFSGFERQVVAFYLSRTGRMFAHLLPLLPRAVQRAGFVRMLGPATQLSRERFTPYARNLRKRGMIPHVLRLLRSWEFDMQRLRHQMRRYPIDLPTLVLWGTEDPVVPASTGAALKAHLPRAELVSLDGVGHLPNEEVPQKCAGLIVDWLAKLR